MKQLLFFFCLALTLSSCDEIIEEIDISKKTVTILAPTNNSILDTTSVIFSWEPVEDATAYHLQIATPNFETAAQIVLDSLVEKSFHNKTLNYGDYEWRIRAENSVYQTDYTINSFTVGE